MVIGSTGTWKGPFGYGGSAGYQKDETRLQLLRHRYYDSSTGRFITRDPIKDGRNWYACCDSNPVNRIDANGLDWHNPTRVKVSPDFKGKVWAIGETGSDNKARRIQVKPGEMKHADMDVDYITVVMPDGTQKSYFLPGVTKGLGNAGPNQTYRIEADGTVHWDWCQGWNSLLNGWPPVQVEGPGTCFDWPFKEWPNMQEESKKTPFPKSKLPSKY